MIMNTPRIGLAARVAGIKASPTLAVDAKAKALKAEGADVLNFSVGEPDFDTPPHVCAAGKAAIDQGFTRYTPVPGILPLREAVCARLAADHGWNYQPAQIQVSSGGKHGLYNMAQALFGPGDEVLIPSPYWVSYPPIVQLSGATPVIVPLDEKNDFDLDPTILAQYAGPATRGIIVNSPSNPTGSVLSATALKAIAGMALERGWVVISDDIYDTILYGAAKLPHILDVDPRIKEQTLILNGVSKSFAMTGWRIGYTAGPEYIIAAMNKIQSQATSNASSIAQKAALAALVGPQDFPIVMRDTFVLRRDFILRALTSIPGLSCVRPRGAFYVFPNMSAYYGRKTAGGQVIVGSVDLADYLLDEALLAAVPGVAFGADEFMRFSFATSMNILAKGMKRLATALTDLK